MFGKGAKTYINEIAKEAYTIFNQDDDVQTWDMQKGKMKEVEAVAYYKNTFGLKSNQIEHYGDKNPFFKEYCEDSGGSPDALVSLTGTSKIDWGVEFKCPKGNTHWEYLWKIEKAADLQKECLDYYTQCQSLMMCFDIDMWHWCSYNEYFPVKERMLIVEVPKDKSFQDNLNIRLQMAKKIKKRMLEQRANGYKGEIEYK